MLLNLLRHNELFAFLTSRRRVRCMPRRCFATRSCSAAHALARDRVSGLRAIEFTRQRSVQIRQPEAPMFRARDVSLDAGF
jgi:hypothetical protein